MTDTIVKPKDYKRGSRWVITSNGMEWSFSIIDKNAQFATNKIIELNLFVLKQTLKLFVVTDHGFNKHNFDCFNSEGYNLINQYSRKSYKEVGVSFFTFCPKRYNFLLLQDWEDCENLYNEKNLEVTGVKFSCKNEEVVAIGLID